MALHIFDTYIEPTSARKQVNLDARTTQELVDEFQMSQQHLNDHTWVLTKSYTMLFQSAVHAVKFQLEKDTFPRFVRWGEWLKFVARKGDSLLASIAVLKTAHQFSFTDSDFVDHIVLDKDIAFFKELTKDSFDWDLVGSRAILNNAGTISAFINKKKLFPQVSFYQNAILGKWCGILNYPFELVKNIVLPARCTERYDRNVIGFKYYDFFTPEQLKNKYPHIQISTERSCIITRVQAQLPWPFKTVRSTTWASCCVYEPQNQTIFLLHKPCKHEVSDNEANPSWINHYDYCYFAVTKIDESRTLFYQIHIVDLGGLAQKAIKLLFFDRGVTLTKYIIRELEEEQKNPRPLEEDDPYLRIMRDAEERVSNCTSTIAADSNSCTLNSHMGMQNTCTDAL